MTLFLATWLTSLLALAFVLVSALMMLIILVQKPKGGGLSGAFGGAGGGSTNAAFGAKVGDVLTWTTGILFLLFLLLAMGLTWTIAAEVDTTQPATVTSQDEGAGGASGDTSGGASGAAGGGTVGQEIGEQAVQPDADVEDNPGATGNAMDNPDSLQESGANAQMRGNAGSNSFETDTTDEPDAPAPGSAPSSGNANPEGSPAGNNAPPDNANTPGTDANAYRDSQQVPRGQINGENQLTEQERADAERRQQEQTDGDRVDQRVDQRSPETQSPSGRQ